MKEFSLPEDQTTLKEDAGQGAGSVSLTAPGFAGPGDVVIIANEFARIIGQDGDNFRLIVPVLKARHPKETTAVRRRSLTGPVGSLTLQIPGQTTTMKCRLTQEVNPKDILMFDDAGNTEFVMVKSVGVIPGDGLQSTITFSTLTRFGHGRGVPFRRVVPELLGFAGGDRVDFTQPFAPFGEQPSQAELFYFGLRNDWLPVSTITVRSARVPITPDITLQWEFFDGTGWKNTAATDLTAASSRDGTVAFPSLAVVPTKVNEQSNYWVRVRVATGDYGQPVEFIMVDPNAPKLGFTIRSGSGNLIPPTITKLRLKYTAEDKTPFVLTQNEFFLEDQTPKNASGDRLFYKLFVPAEEKDATFYLGFNEPLPNNAINLYFALTPRPFGERILPAAADLDQDAPEVQWDYWNGTWKALVVVDDTRQLTESGVVQFLGPTDLAPLAKFDTTPRYWIRARRTQGGSEFVTWLNGLFLNAVRAVQAGTASSELLGSSNGREHQVFRLAQPPVLPGQSILVREPEPPPAEDGADIVRTDTDGVWLRWEEVRSLNLSSERSRHYTLDRITGEVRFGDNAHGLIPPLGRDNIVCETYRSGGGDAGNQPAGAINQLKTSLPAIAAVRNGIASDGGSAAETVAAVEQRGPQTLKHRGHPVTPGDYEWLARQAAGTRVARARCLSNLNFDLAPEDGWVSIIIVPTGVERKLLPSSELTREVEDDFATRSLVTLTDSTPARINIIGPGYVPVELAVEIMPEDLTQADAVRKAVLDALDEFLHPLTGGPDKTGWAFGRDVFLSELYAAFENVAGVEHVHSLEFKPTVAVVPLKFEQPALGAHFVPAVAQVAFGACVLRGRLVEDIRPDTVEAMVTVFREGERVLLKPLGNDDAPAVEVAVRGISGATLTVDPFRACVVYPAGSLVASADGTSASFLTSPIEKDAVVSLLPVQGFGPRQRLALLREPRLVAADFGDATGLITKLTAATLDPISAYLVSQISAAGMTVLGDPGATAESKLAVLVAELNRILRTRDIFGSVVGAANFDPTMLAQDTLDLAALQPKGESRLRLNRQVLDDSYSEHIHPSRETLFLKSRDDDPSQLDLGLRMRVPRFYLVYSGEHTVVISPT